jgi:Cdc6-like AAA superfamily ATPase
VKNSIGCIIIANNPSLDSNVDSSTRSSFVPTRISFKNYPAGEIRDILWERCQFGFQEGIIDQATIASFAKHLTSYSHDLRTAFQVLSEVGEYIESKGKKTVELDDLIDVLKIVEKKELVEMIIGLEDLQKILLFLIAHICKKSKKDRCAATSDAVWEALQTYAKRFKGVTEKSQRHIFERVLPNLEAQGFFSTGIKGLGRGKGQIKYFCIQESNLELFYDALLEQMPSTVENWSLTGDILNHNRELLKNGGLKKL